MKAVEINNLTKKYGQRTILENISLSVDEGEMVSLIGPSGCGKSTILNIIGLLETYDKGTISIFGEILPKIESHKAMMMRRETINYLFQSFALLNDTTVLQNLLLSMHFVNLSKNEKMEKVNQVLDAVHLLPLKDAIVNTLSGGEQQRVALARTMLKPGKLILADEPTGSLDANAANVSFALLQNLTNQYHKTVIVVTHSSELAHKTNRVIDLKALLNAHKTDS